jgi:hypothetical protein
MNGIRTFRITLVLLFALLLVGLVQIRCRHDGLNVANLDKVYYEKDIRPILSGCSDGISGCHMQRGESGYVFTDYISVMKSIIPFNAQKSPAYKAITGKGFVQLMPPSGALSLENRILIRVWIDQGAINKP